MTDLQLFLTENPVDNITEKVILCKRLEKFPFTIKPLSGADFERYNRQASAPKQKGSKQKEVDSIYLNDLIVLNHCVEPNFKDAEWLQKLGTPTDTRAGLHRVLKQGEIIRLANYILRLSGFNVTIEPDAELEDMEDDYADDEDETETDVDFVKNC